jgi:hypothetical protein
VEDLQEYLASDGEDQGDDGRYQHRSVGDLAAEGGLGLGGQGGEDDERLQRAHGHEKNRQDVDEAELHARSPLLAFSDDYLAPARRQSLLPRRPRPANRAPTVRGHEPSAEIDGIAR